MKFYLHMQGFQINVTCKSQFKVHVPVDELVGGLDAVVAAHGDSSAGAETF